MDGKRFIANVKGVGVKGVAREFYMSAKSDELTGGSWSTEIPNLGNNKYLWYRDKFALTNGTVATTTPICDGAWEAIYNIYDINKNITSYVKDVEELKTKVQLKTDVQPIERGGTGGTSRKAGFENLSRITPPSSDNDTPSAWAAVGDGYCSYTINIFWDGILLNLGSGTDMHRQMIFGIFKRPFIYIRRTRGDVWDKWIPAVENNESLEGSLERNTSNTPSNSSYTCYMDIAKKRVYFRGYVATRDTKVYKSGEANVLWTVPESYRPPTRYALAVSNGGGVVGQAYIGSSGEITLIARGGNIGTENLIYITGWWDTEIMTN